MADMTVAWNPSGGSVCPAYTYDQDLKSATGKVTFPAAYEAGGHGLTIGKPWFREARYVQFEPQGGYVFTYDWANQKVKAHRVGDHTHQTAAHTHTTTGDAVYFTHTIVAVPGCIATDAENADAASLPTNGNAVAAAAAVAAGAWAHGAITHPTHGRNLCISVTNDSGGPLNLFEGVSTFTITGTFKGAAQSDAIAFTSTAANKAVATGKFRYKFGVKPFDTVTNITVDNVPDNGLKIGVGPGPRFGLPNALASGTAADIAKATVNSVTLDTSAAVEGTHNTINLGVLTDASNATIIYKGLTALTGISEKAAVNTGASADAALAEVDAGTNLSTLGAINFTALGV